MAVPSLPSILTGPSGPISDAPAPARKAEPAVGAKTDEARLSAGAAMLSKPAGPQEIDAAKVAELRQRLANGDYAPDARAIADKLMQEAWLSRG